MRFALCGVCGIELRARELTIRPHPHPSLGFAEGERRTPIRTVRSAWRYKTDWLIFVISVPVPARVELPDGRSYEVNAGEYRYEILL